MTDEKNAEKPKIVTPTKEQTDKLAREFAEAMVANLNRKPKDDEADG